MQVLNFYLQHACVRACVRVRVRERVRACAAARACTGSLASAPSRSLACAPAYARACLFGQLSVRARCEIVIVAAWMHTMQVMVHARMRARTRLSRSECWHQRKIIIVFAPVGQRWCMLAHHGCILHDFVLMHDFASMHYPVCSGAGWCNGYVPHCRAHICRMHAAHMHVHHACHTSGPFFIMWMHHV